MIKLTYKIGVFAFIAFIILFTAIFYLNKNSAQTKFDTENSLHKGITTSSADKTKSLIDSYGVFSGILLGIISFILTSIIYAIIRKVKKSICISAGISYILLLILAFELVFLENRFTAWANGIIFYLGVPLLYTSLIVILGLAILFFIGTGDTHE